MGLFFFYEILNYWVIEVDINSNYTNGLGRCSRMNVASTSNVGAMPIVSPITGPSSVGGQDESSRQPANATVDKLSTEKELTVAEQSGVKLSVGEAQLIRAIDRAIKALEGPETRFEMKVHEGTNAVTVKVFNKETGDLIREVPPEKTLDLVLKMKEIAGLLVDEKV